MEKQEKIPYEEIFKALNRAKVNYAVCGGLAVVLYGYTRLTADLDLVVDLGKENLMKLYDTLTRLGYKIRIPIKRKDFIQKEKLSKFAEEKNMKVISFHNLKDSFKTVDIGVNLPGISEFLKKKKHIKVGNLAIPTISIDDLIKMKKDVARYHDLTDVENLKKIKKEKRY
jgi:predicted nucleotidyltransferase